MTPTTPIQTTYVFSANCPLCHTAGRTVTPESLAGGARWACTTCGQTWSARRLEAAAAYAQYAATH